MRLWNRRSSGARLTVRKAVMHDIPPILALINGYAAKGIMLPRTEFEMSEAIRDFMVVTRGEEFLGCGALHFYTPTIGEIRSLAVHEHAKTHGVGRQSGGGARRGGAGVRAGRGFRVYVRRRVLQQGRIRRGGAGVLPLKAWKDCVRCPKFQACDEIAVLRVLRPERWNDSQPQQWPAGRIHPDPHAAACRQYLYPQSRGLPRPHPPKDPHAKSLRLSRIEFGYTAISGIKEPEIRN